MNRNLLYLLFFYSFSLLCSAQDTVAVRPLELKTNVKSSQSISYPTLLVDDSEFALRMQSLHFEDAKKSIQTRITQAKRKKQDITELESQLHKCDNGISALQATNKIVFIDSIVVDKDKLLSAYKFDDELGSISLSANKETTSFTTELGNFTYRAEKEDDGSITINSYFIEDNELTNKSNLKGIEIEGDINYPFLLSDGTTLYFAARSDEGQGNYDLYVTRYDREEDTYLQPTNLGYPFNSYANDYLMVVDEDLGIGWFASDRNQPADKVCVYTFIQPKSRTTFDYETDDHNAIISSARITSIKDTWKGNEDAIRTARQQLTLKQNILNDNANKYDFSFVINDYNTYHFLSDFKSSKAKAKFLEYQKAEQQVENLNTTLSHLRHNPKGATIRAQILQIESELADAQANLHSLAKETRALELQ